jgi:hypothetical protein
MHLRLTVFVFGGCLLFGAMQSATVQAVEPFVLYDDFNSKLINPTKWLGTEFGGAGRDLIRKDTGSKLRMLAASYGRTASDSGKAHEHLGLRFTNSEAVTAIAATTRVMRAKIKGCILNPDPTAAAAHIGGSFFNTGTPTPGSHLNDVAAFMEIVRYTEATGEAGPLHVRAVVRQCTAVDEDEDCADSTALFSQNLGPVAVGDLVELLLQWDQANHQFLFQRDDQAIVAYQYTVDDSGQPGVPGKRVAISERVANCTVTPRPSAVLDALFDDVRVNASAAPD